MKLVFSSIQNCTIFEPEFQNITPYNGTIEFKHMNTAGGIAVVYGPNGTGKSSLANVLSAETSSDQISFAAVDDFNTTITPESKAFHVIPDQINRNVIRGKETDYLIGQQIRREYELRDRINVAFENAYNGLRNKYKSDYKISKVGDYLLTHIGALPQIPYPIAFGFLRTVVNKQAHYTDIDVNDFIAFIRDKNNRPILIDLDEEKKKWVIADCSSRSSIVKRIID